MDDGPVRRGEWGARTAQIGFVSSGGQHLGRKLDWGLWCVVCGTWDLVLGLCWSRRRVCVCVKLSATWAN